jgi:hypothetical protein
MDIDNRLIRDPRERLPVLALAVAATLLVFAAINAGFTPHAAEVAGRELPAPGLVL